MSNNKTKRMEMQYLRQHSQSVQQIGQLIATLCAAKTAIDRVLEQAEEAKKATEHSNAGYSNIIEFLEENPYHHIDQTAMIEGAYHSLGCGVRGALNAKVDGYTLDELLAMCVEDAKDASSLISTLRDLPKDLGK